MARFTFAAMLIVGVLLAAACVGDVGDSSGGQATPTSTSGRNTALDGAAGATGGDAEAQGGGGQALDGGNSGSGTGVSSKRQALVPSAAMWSCVRVEPESPPSGEPGWSEGSSGSSGGATGSGEIAPSGTAIAYPATPAVPLPMPSDPGQVEPNARPPVDDRVVPPTEAGRYWLWICFTESVTGEEIDEVKAIVSRFDPEARVEILKSDPPMGSVELTTADPDACEAIAGELRSKANVTEVLCVGMATEPPAPPTELGSYMLSIGFNESVTQQDIDEVAAIVASLDPGAELLLRESFPPMASARLTTGDPDVCKRIAVELGSKSYISRVSCAGTPTEPQPSDSGRLMITIYFSESVEQGAMDEVRALLERFGVIVPDAITMIFPPIISAELPSGGPSTCKVIAGELLSKSYVRDVSCVPSPSEPPVPGDDGGTISTTPIVPGTPSADGTSGIEGRAVAGPTCPVEHVDSPCPDKPIAATVLVWNAGRTEVVAKFATDESGAFRVELAPGEYSLEPLSPQPGVSLPAARLQTVTVRAGEFAYVVIEYDTGIR